MVAAVNYLAFQVGWLACVLGAARGRVRAGMAVALLVVGWGALCAARPGSYLLFLLIVGVLGLAWDSALVAGRLLRYAGAAADHRFAPAWIFVLWLLFATTLDSSLAWLQPHPLLAVLLGAVAGPLTFLGAARMGAVQLLRPRAALTALACGWALLLPTLSRLALQWDQAHGRVIASAHGVSHG
jgi:hypothetical protein